MPAGKTLAEAECKGCHGLDGKGAAPAIPHPAGQHARYLVAAMQEYKEGKRTHAALRTIAAHMSEADMRNLAVLRIAAAGRGGHHRTCAEGTSARHAV